MSTCSFRPSNWSAAAAALGTLGYERAVLLPDEARPRARERLGSRRDAYRSRFTGRSSGPTRAEVWDVLSHETETAVLLGDEVEIPNEAARCVIVALHAAQHGIGQPVIFHDLEKALVIAGVETWRRAFELATAIGGSTPFTGALSLTPPGRELLARTRRDRARARRAAGSELAHACTDLARLLLPGTAARGSSEGGLPGLEARALPGVHASALSACAQEAAGAGDRLRDATVLACSLGSVRPSCVAPRATPRRGKSCEHR